MEEDEDMIEGSTELVDQDLELVGHVPEQG